MNSYDKALETLESLEQGLQRTSEHNYVELDRSRCWRCLGEPGTGPSGVCDRCRHLLLADPPENAPDWREMDLDGAREALSALRAAFASSVDAMIAQIAENWRRALESGPQDPESAENAAEQRFQARNRVFAAEIALEPPGYGRYVVQMPRQHGSSALLASFYAQENPE